MICFSHALTVSITYLNDYIITNYFLKLKFNKFKISTNLNKITGLLNYFFQEPGFIAKRIFWNLNSLSMSLQEEKFLFLREKARRIKFFISLGFN
jgi:hypothetical protein